MRKIKRILVVGEFNSNPKIYTYATSFYKAFKKLGYETFQFNCKQNCLKFFGNTHYYLPGKLQKFNNYLINRFLIKKIKTINPDLIFFLKAENIYSKTIKKIKNNKNIIVNFYPDNPFVTWNGNSNLNVLNSLPFYDCFLIWSQMLKQPLISAGCKSVYYFPFVYDAEVFESFDPSTSSGQALDKKDDRRGNGDVCFVGTWDKEREEWLEKLMHSFSIHPEEQTLFASRRINLIIYGNDWHENLSSDSVLRRHLKGKAVYSDDLLKVFKSSKIVLNFIRKQNMTSHNMRTIEVPATKTFLLTQRTKEQADLLFSEGENIECFSDIDELIEKINFYLTNEDARNKLVDASFEKAQEYEIKKQLQKFLEIL